MADDTNPLHPGTYSTGEAVKAHADAMHAILNAPSTQEPPKPKGVVSPKDLINPKGKFGDKPGEKRLDSQGNEIPKYHTGVDSVPKTGLAVLKKGEKVVPAHKNPDNPERPNMNGPEDADPKPDEDTPMTDEKPEHSPEEKQHFHRAMAHLHGGALHRHFGIPEGQPIPMEKKQEAANSDNPHTSAMGRMAVAMAGWKHGKK